MSLVLGVSGSPVPDSNTDRAVQTVLRATGLPWKFFKLSQLQFEPCRACLRCVETNCCVLEDDLKQVAELFHQAQAVVIGGYTPYGSLDARTKAFMERMYCFHHRIGGNRGKIAVAIVTTACDPENPQLPPAAKTALQQLNVWMLESGIENLGSLIVLGNVPCLRCGYGDQCEVSGLKMIHGPNATVDSVPIRRFEFDQDLVRSAEHLGKKIREKVLQVRE